jgi:hypothetical protein
VANRSLGSGSHSFKIIPGPVASRFTGIQGARRLEEHDVDLPFPHVAKTRAERTLSKVLFGIQGARRLKDHHFDFPFPHGAETRGEGTLWSGPLH